MNEITIEVTALVDAPPERVYAVLRDYEAGHPAILPPATFREMTVLEGGQGEGRTVHPRQQTQQRRARGPVGLAGPDQRPDRGRFHRHSAQFQYLQGLYVRHPEPAGQSLQQ